ncbi:hypothetical protein PF007_g25350 [Phytophthora fragariae]|uniref:Reverse transcriptase RNase H-like domain-containing protein n=1 Tax=Phytophthora fragariae TaxID=53985 RepID=A0A6A4C227_9STRA|nr:hypothetical protein PF003_g8782 [Phytophthora fragariae]KAE8923997.1 hypothetical protein PF009_g25764 [Phytophthora fragariae]KAE9074582.1 hypothetical protein PF007_g25350 [Phytophthora fragariae]KAE9092903.1 hypothetical protein PF006_g24574 [Phytophthora fragariae]KAE9280123.1 hypothetical protein PF001_g24379 [Phytophthora fragariae]
MKKCKWGRDQVAFLGHIVTPSGILPNPEKVKSVMNVKRPHDLHTVRAFLGLTSYFRRYIPGYAGISAPIERLKPKGAAFVWTDDCEAAFMQLKRKLIEPPILVYPDFSKRFKLYVDSSKQAVGACLMQTVDGRDRVVAYTSKLLMGSEKNWIHKQDGTSEIKCWGIVWATRKFRCYLDRQEFDLFTDHKALTWVFDAGNRTSNAKLVRWAMELWQLRFKVFHKAGTAMGHVDGLSRLHYSTVNALAWADLLNAEEDEEEDRLVQVEDEDTVVYVPTTTEPRNDLLGNAEITPAPGLLEVEKSGARLYQSQDVSAPHSPESKRTAVEEDDNEGEADSPRPSPRWTSSDSTSSASWKNRSGRRGS